MFKHKNQGFIIPSLLFSINAFKDMFFLWKGSFIYYNCSALQKKTLLWFNCTSRQFMRILQIAELLLIRLCSICTAATLFYKWTIHERQGECQRENYVNFWKTVPSRNYAYPKNAFLPSREDLRPKWQFCPPAWELLFHRWNNFKTQGKH